MATKGRQRKGRKTGKGGVVQVFPAALLTFLVLGIFILVPFLLLDVWSGLSSTPEPVDSQVSATPSPVMEVPRTPEPLPLETIPDLVEMPLPSPVTEVVPTHPFVPPKASRDPGKKNSVGVTKKDDPVTPRMKGTLYLVLDDGGYNVAQARRFLKLPFPLTMAVLPGLPHTGDIAHMVSIHGKELMLHQPLEALNVPMKDPGLIRMDMQKDDQRAIFSANIEQMGAAAGVNNHQGSRGVQDLALMRVLMSELQARNMYFLDSRTIASGVPEQAAREAGVPFVQRDVFLDNEADPAEIRNSLEKGMEIASDRGYAVMIGHVWSDELYDVLLQDYLSVEARGFRFDMLGQFFLARNAARPERIPGES